MMMPLFCKRRRDGRRGGGEGEGEGRGGMILMGYCIRT